MKRYSPVLIAVLLLTAFAAAQVDSPCVPTSTKTCNANVAPVPYETPQFKVTFNTKVYTWSEPNTPKTSLDYFYSSKAGDIEQMVTFRAVTNAIPVEQSSLDFYTQQQEKFGTLKSRRDIDFYGHLSTYLELYTTDGRLRRFWLIIYDPHTVFVLMQLAPKEGNDNEDWNKFSNSFAIRLAETSCWLPEGCTK